MSAARSRRNRRSRCSARSRPATALGVGDSLGAATRSALAIARRWRLARRGGFARRRCRRVEVRRRRRARSVAAGRLAASASGRCGRRARALGRRRGVACRRRASPSASGRRRRLRFVRRRRLSARRVGGVGVGFGSSVGVGSGVVGRRWLCRVGCRRFGRVGRLRRRLARGRCGRARPRRVGRRVGRRSVRLVGRRWRSARPWALARRSVERDPRCRLRSGTVRRSALASVVASWSQLRARGRIGPIGDGFGRRTHVGPASALGDGVGLALARAVGLGDGDGSVFGRAVGVGFGRVPGGQVGRRARGCCRSRLRVRLSGSARQGDAAARSASAKALCASTREGAAVVGAGRCVDPLVARAALVLPRSDAAGEADRDGQHDAQQSHIATTGRFRSRAADRRRTVSTALPATTKPSRVCHPQRR